MTVGQLFAMGKNKKDKKKTNKKSRKKGGKELQEERQERVGVFHS